MNTAAFAEAVVVDASQCVRLPADLPADLACLLACGVITGVGAVVNAGRMAPGASVAVVGAGGVGLNAVQGAAHRRGRADRGGGREPGEARRRRGPSARPTRCRRAPAPARRSAALTGGRGVDLAVVTVGAPAAIGDGGGLLAAGGALVVVGMPATGSVVGYDPTTLAAMNQTHHRRAHGPRGAGARHPLADRALAGGAAEARGAGHRRATALEEINEAIAATRSGAARRNVIVFGT